MWVIFGLSKRKKDLGQYSYYCTHCDRVVVHSVQQQQNWFTLFFIPVLPLNKAQASIHCNVCGQESPYVKGHESFPNEVESLAVDLSEQDDGAEADSIVLLEAKRAKMKMDCVVLKKDLGRFQRSGWTYIGLAGFILLVSLCMVPIVSDQNYGLLEMAPCLLGPILLISGLGGFKLWRARQLKEEISRLTEQFSSFT